MAPGSVRNQRSCIFIARQVGDAMAPGSVRNQRSCIFIARHSTNDRQRTSQVSLGGRFVMRSLARCSEVLLLDEVENESEVLSLLTVVSDGDRRGALDLAGVAFLVIVAVAEPLTEIHPRVDLDKRNAGGLGHGAHEFLVLR